MPWRPFSASGRHPLLCPSKLLFAAVQETAAYTQEPWWCSKLMAGARCASTGPRLARRPAGIDPQGRPTALGRYIAVSGLLASAKSPTVPRLHAPSVLL